MRGSSKRVLHVHNSFEMKENFNDSLHYSGYKNDTFWDDELDYLYEEYYLTLLVSFVLSILLIFGAIIANGLVCWILFRGKRFLKSFANFHLLNLALTDLIFRALLAPVVVTLENTELSFGSDAICKFAAMGNYTTLAVTFALLAGIAFDRYVHIVFPLRARSISWKHSRNAVCISWIYALACSSPFLFSTKYEKIEWNHTSQTSGICSSAPGLRHQISMTVFFICAFLAPLIVMGIAYGSILRILIKRAKSKLINNTVARSKLKAVKMMLVIGLAYVISWGPKLTWKLLQAFGHFYILNTSEETVFDDEHDWISYNKTVAKYLIVLEVFEVLALTSSVLNPLIFGYYSGNFRQELKKLCCRNACCRKCNSPKNEPAKKLMMRNTRQRLSPTLETKTWSETSTTRL